MQDELPSGPAVLLRCRARGLEHVVRDPGERRALLDVHREGVGRIERVLGELGRELRRLFLDFGVALLLLGRKLRPGEPEVADLVLDDLLLRARQPFELGSGAQRLVLLEEGEVLPERGPVLHDLRLVLLVRLAQLRRVEHRVQVADDAPGAPEPLVRVLERLRETRPGRRRLGLREPSISARLSASSWSIAGAMCSGRTAANRGRPEKSRSGFASICIGISLGPAFMLRRARRRTRRPGRSLRTAPRARP